MIDEYIGKLRDVLAEYKSLGIADQIDYHKFYLYSLITHSTAIEGSTVTEIENQLLFDDGISAKGKPMVEQLMNLDLMRAYQRAKALAERHEPFSTELLKSLSALVMRNTGSPYSTPMGEFDSSAGDIRLCNVTAGAGGRSYLNFQKVPSHLADFCKEMNERRQKLIGKFDEMEAYILSFDAHNELVAIHPWVDGNGRMSRLMMNYIQMEFNLITTKVCKEDKAEYIQSLIDSREEESLLPFQLFMLREHTQNLQSEIDTFKASMAKG